MTWRVVCLVLVALVSAACATQPLSNNELDRVADLPALRQEALSLVNQARGAQGLSGLRASGSLNAAAQAHAEDMARRGFFGHVSPERRDIAYRYRAHGGGQWRIIAENITQCSACRPTVGQVRSFQQGWMQSAGHRRNILDARFEAFGFGMASAGGRIYAVQTFVGERQ